ncbi:MAG: hypothetical protein ACI9JL_000890 [Paracoccaceae bacterium]
MKYRRRLIVNHVAKLIALATLATLVVRYDVFVFIGDYIAAPVHTWMLAFAYLTYGGFGLLAIVGLWLGKSWGGWTYYLHVLSGTINFSYAVIPFTPGFADDYLYYAWFIGGNVGACLIVMWTRAAPVAPPNA